MGLLDVSRADFPHGRPTRFRLYGFDNLSLTDYDAYPIASIGYDKTDYVRQMVRFIAVPGAYVAALNRAQAAVTNYRQAPAIEEAMWIMIRSYDALGMPQLRDDATRVFKANFPNSQLTADGRQQGKDNKAWWKLWQ